MMTKQVDADLYRTHLGIETTGSKPDHYALLGLKGFRVTENQVNEAFEQRLGLLQGIHADDHGPALDGLVEEIKSARDCLIAPNRKRAYDRLVQRSQLVRSATSKGNRETTRKALTPDSNASRTSNSTRPVNTETVASSDPASLAPSRWNFSMAGDEDSSTRKRAATREDAATRDVTASQLGKAEKHPKLPASIDPDESDASSTSSRPSAAPREPHANYEILHEIGRGSSSIVYEAYDRVLGRYVAIKELDERFQMDRIESDLFWQEARFLAETQHDNIVGIHGVEQSRRWIILELMKGNLQKQIASGRTMDPNLVHGVLRQVLEALHFLHQRDKIHGEVKLSNILVDQHGGVKLSDSPGFSVGGEFRTPSSSHRHVAPEMLKPGSFGPISPGVDLYSLGFAIMELLIGDSLHESFAGVSGEGDELNLAWLRWHGSESERVPDIRTLAPNVPEDMACVIERLTSKRPEERYQSAADVLADLAHRPIALLEMGAEQEKSLENSMNSSASVFPAASDTSRTATAPEESGLTAAIRAVAKRHPILMGVAVTVSCLMLAAMLSSGSTTSETVSSVPDEAVFAVSVTTIPPTNALWDGSPIQTPFDQEVSPGEYSLKIDTDGYKKVSETIKVEDQNQKLSYVLEPLQQDDQRTYSVNFMTTPSGASIIVDGENRGVTPTTVELDRGMHHVQVSLPDYFSVKDSVNISKNDTLKLTLRKRAAEEQKLITITTIPHNAKVTVDGVAKGRSPIQIDAVTDQDFQLSFSLKGYESLERSLSTRDGKLEYEFKLTRTAPSATPITPVPTPSPIDEYQQTLTEEALRNLAAAGRIPIKVRPLNSTMPLREQRIWVRVLGDCLGTDNVKMIDGPLWQRAKDSRLIYAKGLIHEARRERDKALEYYKLATRQQRVAPSFAPWHRMILMTMQDGRKNDIQLALTELTRLLDEVTRFAENSGESITGSEGVIAHNLRFIGRVVGLVQQRSHPKIGYNKINVDGQDETIKAKLKTFPLRYQHLTALYDIGKNDIADEFWEQRKREDRTTDKYRTEASERFKRTSQGEKETRTKMGPHEPAPEGMDYYEDQGSPGDIPFILPDRYESLKTKDGKTNTEWIREHQTKHVRANRESNTISKFFPVNVEDEKNRLMESFPDRLKPQTEYIGEPNELDQAIVGDDLAHQTRRTAHGARG